MKENYPSCDACGHEMNIFDGVNWYTCPECGNSVRVEENGSLTWERDIFDNSKKAEVEHPSDFDLANFCHGGDLLE